MEELSGRPRSVADQVAAARAGKEPAVVARCRSGWVVLGDVQRVPGYCLLLPDPPVPDLNTLAGDEREAFLADMAGLGDALLAATDAERINYEILGNSEPWLHAHVVPRYAHESPERRREPIWSYPENRAPRFDARRDAALGRRIEAELRRLGRVRETREGETRAH